MARRFLTAPKRHDRGEREDIMEAHTSQVDTAVAAGDYVRLATIFAPPSMSRLGQGEQRALAGHFIKKAVSSETFLPKAFASSEVMHVMALALGNLPNIVEGAADNTLRQMLFDYKVNDEEDYSGAARVLAGMRMEDVEGSPYYRTPADKCDGKCKSQSMHDCIEDIHTVPSPSLCEGCRVLFGGRRDRGGGRGRHQGRDGSRINHKPRATHATHTAIQIDVCPCAGRQSQVSAGIFTIP